MGRHAGVGEPLRLLGSAVATVAVLAFAGCGSDKTDHAARVCRSQHGAKVCLERVGGQWTFRAEGFKPGSQLTQVLGNQPGSTDNRASPITLLIGDHGTYPRSKAETSGVVVPAGQRATLIVTGTARDGAKVRLSIPVTS